MQDSIWDPLESPTDEHDYIQVSETVPRVFKLPKDMVGTSFEHMFIIDNNVQVEKRIRYNFWTALADVGGFHDGLVLILGLFMSPFAAMMFENDLVKGNLLANA